MSQVRVRPFAADDWPTFQWVDELAFGYTPEGVEEGGPDQAVLDHDRSLIAEIDGEAVGIASAYSPALSVPGGASVPTAGTTWVGVLPTHRRRGVLRALMHRHLADASARGDVLAALWASEPGIYGRFGYGEASRALTLDVPTGLTLAAAPREDTLVVRLVDPEQARPALAVVYAEAARQRPGAPARDDRWWDRTLHDPLARRAGASARRCLVVTGPEGPQGYALYATVPGWTDGSGTGTVSIRELVSTRAAARAALWRVLIGHDLMRRVEWHHAPVDEPLLTWADARVGRRLSDQVHLRLLDLPGALQARTYALDVDVVVEVVDALLPANAGRWHLTAGAAGLGRCERTDLPAQVILDVRELAAAYLGARSLEHLADLGLVRAPDPAALVRASRALLHWPAAWCPHVF